MASIFLSGVAVGSAGTAALFKTYYGNILPSPPPTMTATSAVYFAPTPTTPHYQPNWAGHESLPLLFFLTILYILWLLSLLSRQIHQMSHLEETVAIMQQYVENARVGAQLKEMLDRLIRAHQ